MIKKQVIKTKKFIAGGYAALSLLAVCSLSSCSDDTSSDGTSLNVTGLEVTVGDADALNASLVTNYKATANATKSRAVDASIFASVENLTMPEEPTVPTATELTTDQQWVTHSGNYKVSTGKSFEITSSFNLNNTVIYVSGTATLSGNWNSGSNNTTIYVLSGGKLIINESELQKVDVYNYGTITSTNGFGIQSGSSLYTTGDVTKLTKSQGTLYVGGSIKESSNNIELTSPAKTKVVGDMQCNNLTMQSSLYVGGNLTLNTSSWNQTALVNVVGNMTSTSDISLDGTTHCGGAFTAPNITIGNSGQLYSDCSVKTPGAFKINSNNTFIELSYLEAASIYQCASSTIKLYNGSYINCSGQYENQNNGQGSVTLYNDATTAVVKAASVKWNKSDDKCNIFRTPGTGSIIALDVKKYYDNSNKELAYGTDFQFEGANLKFVSDGTSTTDDGYKAYIAKSDCNPGYGNTPSTGPHLDLVTDIDYDHDHDISATCVQPYNGKIYLSYHLRGTGQSGCLEVLSTDASTNKTTLLQFLQDKNNELDFNHLMIDPDTKRLYTAGNSSKKGAIVTYIDLKSDGLMNTTANETAEGTYLPLQMIQLESAATKTTNDANCIIRNGNLLSVAMTSGLKSFNASTLEETETVTTPGKAKHIAINGTTVAVAYLANAVTSTDEAAPVTIKTYTSNGSLALDQAKQTISGGTIQPNDGKNVLAIDGNNLYISLGRDGFASINATTGEKQWTYQPENILNSDGTYKGYCNGCTYDSKYIYLAYGSYGLIVLDKTTHKLVDMCKDVKSANYVTLDNGYIYVAYGRDRLQVFKLVE